jgi:penicillin-binding protein 2
VLGGYGDERLGSHDPPLSDGRLGLVASVIVLTFTVFTIRLFQLQILEGADLRSRSIRNSVRTLQLEAPRGVVLDREGKVIAANRPAFRVQVIPNELTSPEQTFEVLGQLLERPPEELRERVGTPRGRRRFQPIELEGDLGYDRRTRVESHRFALAGVVTDVRPRRHYLEGRKAAHMLGSIGEIHPRQLKQPRFADYRAGEIIGQVGLEARLEDHLRGRVGGRNVIVDVAGREVSEIDEIPPVPGGRAVLNIDLDLQRIADAAFDDVGPDEPARMGALVALDPRNGEVLALVARPNYDPNDFAGGIDKTTWRQLTTDEWQPLQNRAIAGQYAPGSTFKAIVAVAGLSENVIAPDDEVFCPGYYRLGRRTYRCWKRGGHGSVNLEQALVHSCDVYFYQLGVKLGIDRIGKYSRAFGFGRVTGIDLPGEKSGLVPTREWKERVKKEPWQKGETVSVAIGQGANLVTVVQLASAFAALGNGGTLIQPRLLRRLETWDGKFVEQPEPASVESVDISPEVLEIVKRALTAVVGQPRGTGGRARVRGIDVAGKTGTTQVVSLDRIKDLEDEDVPVRYRDHALFAAFAPADEPEITVAVIVEHAGKGGGTVAAPIAQRVLARFFEKRAERLENEMREAEPEGPVADDADTATAEPARSPVAREVAVARD